MTTMPQDAAARFIKEFSIPWPSGYGAAQTIADFGAFNRTAMIRGYETIPILYLIGPDGRIVWTDQQARSRHEEMSGPLRELEAEIEKVLAEAAPKGQKKKRPDP
jgi:hypothetical protein